MLSAIFTYYDKNNFLKIFCKNKLLQLIENETKDNSKYFFINIFL